MPPDTGLTVPDAAAFAAPGPETEPAGTAEEADATTFKGYVDGLSHQWRVVGWARPLLPGQERLQVRLLENDDVLDSAVADLFRGDLLGAMIGDGKFGFSLKIPPRLFDGLRHTLLVCVAGVAGPGLVGQLDVALPNRATSKAPGLAAGSAADLLQAILPARDTGQEEAETRAAELTQALQAIARIFDHATALGCLYVHVLRRRIDHDGLQTRLTRLSNAPGELATVVREVLASEEAKNLYKPGSAHRFPDIAALEVWTRLRR
jgi:hypothetical protein